jgi:acyl-CoA hydrolase
MFAQGVIDLVNKGVVTNLGKNFLPGKLVTSFVMGNKRVYDFINDNPFIYFLDSSITNHPVIIGSNPKVTAINAAVEVDITGQVCAGI